MILEIQVNGRWTKVTYYIFRSWTGLHRMNGKPWYGPPALLGKGYTERNDYR